MNVLSTDYYTPVTSNTLCTYEISVRQEKLFIQVAQSNARLAIDDKLIVEATRVSMPKKAGKPPSVINLKEFIANRIGPNGCLLEIRNSDQLCVPRAVVCGIARAQRNDSEAAKKKWDNIRHVCVCTILVLLPTPIYIFMLTCVCVWR
ncbi:MAG: hypothetical protein GY820_32310 [Gammaproteobacteria bacterium]|nr:hypothetical protein [Gammaproteobacteria bacterium]